MVSKTISPVSSWDVGTSLKRTVSFGSRATLSIIKLIRTFTFVVSRTRINVVSS